MDRDKVLLASGIGLIAAGVLLLIVAGESSAIAGSLAIVAGIVTLAIRATKREQAATLSGHWMLAVKPHYDAVSIALISTCSSDATRVELRLRPVGPAYEAKILSEPREPGFALRGRIRDLEQFFAQRKVELPPLTMSGERQPDGEWKFSIATDDQPNEMRSTSRA